MRCIMIFFDTNVLVYATINQGDEKLALAEQVIEDAIMHNHFLVSPLVISEYIFILSKLKIVDRHHEDIALYTKYTKGSIDKDILLPSYKLCREIDFCKNMNDAMHLKVAEQYCTKLVTFDSDFKKLQHYTNIEIEILK